MSQKTESIIPTKLQPLAEEARKYKSAEEFMNGIGRQYFVHGSRADFEKFDLGKFQSGEGMGGWGKGMSVGDNVNFVHDQYATQYGEGTGENLYLIPKKGLNIITPEEANAPATWGKIADALRGKKFNLPKLADKIDTDIDLKVYLKNDSWNEGYLQDLSGDHYDIYDEVMKSIGVDGVGDLKPYMSPIYEGLDVAQNTGVTLFEPDKLDLIKTSKSELIDLYNQATLLPWVSVSSSFSQGTS